MENFTLLQILEAFCAPINEEQAWAVCYQCAKYLKSYLLSSLDDNSVTASLSKPIKRLKENQKHDNGVFALGDVSLNSDGNVEVTIGSKIQEKVIVQSLGILIFQALDFGLNDTEEQKLSQSLESLIGRMTGEGEVAQDGDEGIVDDEKTDMSLEDVVQECIKHIGLNIDVGAHCKAVCRALVHESGELIMFLERVVSESEKKAICGQLDNVDQNQLLTLQRKDWARLWMQVMKELRQGVKLKKVQQSTATHPVEYELTPYEILMDDVRCKRYTLNKVEKNEDVYPIKVKKDVHEIILEFIRSRPPLQPVNKRILCAPQAKHVDPREQLLQDIRTNKPRLRPTPGRAIERVCSVSMDHQGSQPKKVIKPDLSLLSFGSFDIPFQNEFDPSSEGRNLDDKNKVTVSDMIPLTPLSPKSPPKHLPWQHTDDQHNTFGGSDKFSAVTVVPISSSLAFFPSLSSSLATSRQDSTVASNRLPESSAKNRLLEFRDFNMASTVECLSLTVEEVMHIRGVLTKAELECASVNSELYSLLESGKVCFICKKVKFSIFGPWSTKCKFCCRNVCSQCSSKMRIPTEHFEHIPVYTLNPCSSSPINSADVHCLDNSLTGSAPSSPERELPSFSSRSGAREPDERKDKFQKTFSVDKRKKHPLLRSQRPEVVAPSAPRGLFQRSQTIRPYSAAAGSPSHMLEGGPLMNVCSDCRSMVVSIIRASRRCLALMGQRGAHGRAERAFSACPSTRKSFNSVAPLESTNGQNP